MTKDTKLSACAADICRCLSFGYMEDSSFKDIPALRLAVIHTILLQILITASLVFLTSWIEVLMSIFTLRFGLSLSQDAFASPEKNPNNECFCIHKKKKKRYRCRINGIMDLGGCQSKAPLILSGPHFLDTDPDLSKLVNGLNPDPAVHATYVDIEPVILSFSSHLIVSDLELYCICSRTLFCLF